MTMRSFETLALDVPLRFPVPPLAATIDGADDYWWRYIEYGTDLTDPTTFPPFEQPVDEAVLRVCGRYLDTARDLASSVTLNYPISISVSVPDTSRGDEDVSFDTPPADAMAGFAAILRHFYSPNEQASFSMVLKRLRTHSATQDERCKADQFAQLEKWRKVEATSRKRSVQNHALKQLIADGRVPNSPDLDTYPDVAPPEKLIGDYFYGDHLHWGDYAEVVNERAKSPFEDAWHRYAFFVATAGLGHLYVGFATLVETALGNQLPSS
jgi:hypothetical protein